ncbi:hypothetical protein [Ruegeria lacuscaerulensis]|uniref:hypothetical protein n=1 Tax=Ruegeria lacuscaerulensis TaxID=55218 RepID=UPI0014802D65|nr:hypothetical protein [Ruegeria lacuscaerulensis]
MTDHPILFSGPMVRALLDGRKTQTRRILNPQPEMKEGANPEFTGWRAERVGKKQWALIGGMGYGSNPFKVPYAVGDRLWVRETWRTLQKWDHLKPSLVMDDFDKIDFEATGYHRNPVWAWGKSRPSIFLPRWASRLSLTVTDVRVQLLRDISEEDAIAEGCSPFFDEADPQIMKGPNGTEHRMAPLKGPRDSFKNLWDGLNADRGFGFEANPWVAAYTFTVHQENIDCMGEAA